jgi:hypothetical protein
MNRAFSADVFPCPIFAGALPQAEIEWRAFGAKRRQDCLRHESDFLMLGLERLYASNAGASSRTGYAVCFLRSQR